jgi:shikimate dehydrogenase
MIRLKTQIDSGTMLCCLIGDPVSQSPSPGMLNSAFRSANINFIYLSFRVSRENLKDVINGLRALDVRGFNVTIPHKETVCNLVDNLDNTASKLGAVNTVVNDEGQLYGVNTDIDGFIEPMKEKDILLKKIRCLILGSGGAARACLAGLIREGCTDFIILNRNLARAENMIGDMKQNFEFDAKIGKLDLDTIRKEIVSAKLIVNATPIGMYPNVGKSAVPKEDIREDHIVYDLVYKPVKTKLVEYAETAGATVIYGYEMLVNQAAEAFSLWTGIEPHKSLMRRTVVHLLGE